MRDVETNGSLVRMDLFDSATVHFDISDGIYTCECKFSGQTLSPDHKVMVSIRMCIVYLCEAGSSKSNSGFCSLMLLKKYTLTIDWRKGDRMGFDAII